MTQTPDSNSDANGVSPPSSAAPPVGTELRESDRVSYWRSRTSEDQPPDCVGTIEEICEWIHNNPPAEEPEAPASGPAHKMNYGERVVQDLIGLDAAMVRRIMWEGDPTPLADNLPMLNIIHESSPIDTSKPDSVPEPGWKAQQRQTATRERPVVRQETWTSRKLRRASGDRRTVKQIVAEQRREGR